MKVEKSFLTESPKWLVHPRCLTHLIESGPLPALLGRAGRLTSFSTALVTLEQHAS